MLLKSTVKNIIILCSSLSALLTVCPSANAQLNVGNPKIPRGQESQLLQYQLQNNNNLRQLRVIPNCSVGSGFGCNKTVTILDQIIESNGGPTYQQIVIKAAGGENNYRRFSAFYNNNPNLSEVPKMSFWKDPSAQILDGYQYGLGGQISRQPVVGLGNVTRQFVWAPYPGQDLRSGLLNLKMATGFNIYTEAGKIPDLDQKIRLLNLEPEMEQFYLSNIRNGLNALRTGNNEALRQSVFTLLSRPYTLNPVNDGLYGRVEVDAPEALTQPGVPLVPDALDEPGILLSGDEGIGEVVVGLPGDVAFVEPSLNYAWLLPLLLLPFLFGGGDDSSSSGVTTTSPITQPPIANNCLNPTPGGGNNGSPITNPVIEVTCNTFTPPAQPEVRQVIEPSTIKAMLLLTLILCIVGKKHRYMQTKS